jgi:uncharacterized integral membrane protein
MGARPQWCLAHPALIFDARTLPLAGLIVLFGAPAHLPVGIAFIGSLMVGAALTARVWKRQLKNWNDQL